jgi:hypothetical protein
MVDEVKIKMSRIGLSFQINVNLVHFEKSFVHVLNEHRDMH